MAWGCERAKGLVRLAVKWPARRARRWRIGHAAPRSAWGDTSIPGDRTHPGAAVDAAVGARRVREGDQVLGRGPDGSALAYFWPSRPGGKQNPQSGRRVQTYTVGGRGLPEGLSDARLPVDEGAVAVEGDDVEGAGHFRIFSL
jgi:hypothetical protein